MIYDDDSVIAMCCALMKQRFSGVLGRHQQHIGSVFWASWTLQYTALLLSRDSHANHQKTILQNPRVDLLVTSHLILDYSKAAPF